MSVVVVVVVIVTDADVEEYIVVSNVIVESLEFEHFEIGGLELYSVM